MRTITIPVVDSEEGHAAALARIRELWLAEEGTGEAAERETLVTLVCAYEEKTDPWAALPPQEIVRSVMDSHSLSQSDLVPIFGSEVEVLSFLEGRRPITVPEAFKMRELYNVPLDLMLVPQTTG